MDYKNLPKTRLSALENYASHYFTGKPCKNGHLCKRLTENGTCLECERLRVINTRQRHKLFSLYPKTRDEAMEKGLKYFFTGKVCRNGHLNKRRVINRLCIDCYKNLLHINSKRRMLENSDSQTIINHEAMLRFNAIPWVNRVKNNVLKRLA